jgi:signal transduction histidine kinase
VSLDIGEGVGDILGDRIQLVQVIANLLRNSIEATQGAADPVITMRGRAAGDWIEIAVEDNGRGFVSGILPEPGISTTGGSGVGLSVVKRILAAHDSEMVLDPSAERGARISFRLMRREALIGEESASSARSGEPAALKQD